MYHLTAGFLSKVAYPLYLEWLLFSFILYTDNIFCIFHMVFAEMSDFFELQFWKLCISNWKACCRYLVFCSLLRMNESLGVLQNVTGWISCESNEKLFMVWSTQTSVSLTVWGVLIMQLQFWQCLVVIEIRIYKICTDYQIYTETKLQ